MRTNTKPSSAAEATPLATRSRRTASAAVASALVGLAALGMAACGGGGQTEPATKSPLPLPSPTGASQQISEKNLGYLWPLTTDHVTAECRRGDQAVVTTPDGITYALNDRARQAGYRSVDPVRATGNDGHKVSLGALLSRTMKLCQAGR